MRKPSTWSATAGAVAALAVLAALSVMLLNSDGANYKVLVAVWLWLSPVMGFFAGLGYAVGRVIEVISAWRTSGDEGGVRANTR